MSLSISGSLTEVLPTRVQNPCNARMGIVLTGPRTSRMSLIALMKEMTLQRDSYFSTDWVNPLQPARHHGGLR